MSTREFDDIIKRKAQQRKAVVPPDIWEGIAPKKSDKRRPFLLLLFLLLLTGGGILTRLAVNHNSRQTVKLSTAVKKDSNSINSTGINQDAVNRIPAGTDQIKSQQPGDVLKEKDETASSSKTLVPSAQLPGDLPKQQAVFASIEKKISNDPVVTTDHNLLRRKKRNQAKAKYKTTIENGTMEELPVNGNSGNAIAMNEINRGVEPVIREEAQQITINTSTPQPLSLADSSRNSIKESQTDSVVTPMVMLKQKGDSLIAASTKKTSSTEKKQKNTGLTIKAGLTMLFPVQQYEEPKNVQRTLTTTNSSSQFITDRNIKSSIESGNSFHVALVKKLPGKWSIGAGVNYQRFTEKIQLQGQETQTLYSVVQRLDQSPGGPFLIRDTTSSTITYSTTLNGRNIYHNVGIPLFVRYRIAGSRGLSFEITSGLLLNLVRSYSNNIPGSFTTVYADGSKQNGTKNGVGVDAFAGLLISGRFSKKYGWFSAVEYSYNLSPYSGNSLSFKKRIQMPGIAIGINYRLRK